MLEQKQSQSWLERKRKIILPLLLFVGFLMANTVQAGFGVSPPKIIADKLIKGSHFESIVYLVQGNPLSDLQVDISVSGDQINKWVEIEGGLKQVIPAGVQQFPLKVLIDVPEKADFGHYKGYLSLSTSVIKKTDDPEQNQITMSIGARVDLDLTVGDNFVQDFKIRQIKIANIRQGKPLQATVVVENIGNVKIKPERITFDLFDKFANVRLAFVEGDLQKVKDIAPFKTQEIKIKFPVDLKLGIGEYWGEVKVYKDGEVVKSNKTVFNVLKRNIFTEWYFWLIVGAVFVIGGLIFALIKKSRR